MAGQPTNNRTGISEERRFVWRNLEAYLTNEIAPGDRERVERFLCECPYTREYVETEKEFADAVRRCVEDPVTECPEGLREKVLLALDQCEAEEEQAAEQSEDYADVHGTATRGRVLRFPWMGTILMTAAGIMLVVALMLNFGAGADSTEPAGPDIPATLAPMVSRVSLDAPHSENCRYREASSAYRTVFKDGPELPRQFGKARFKVCHFVVDEVDGNPVMCTVYDNPNGERFGVMIFKCKCLDRVASEELMAMEIVIDGKTICLWRQGDYFHALVGTDSATLRAHMGALRRSA